MPAEKSKNDIEVKKDASGKEHWYVSKWGEEVLHTPLINKGSAFSQEERNELGLNGLLPPEPSKLSMQTVRIHEFFNQRDNDLDRYMFLRELQDRNEVLFYHFVSQQIERMMPYIYTPTVGLACQKFSHSFRRARGLYVSYKDRGRIGEVLEVSPCSEPDVIVVTDGERILGLGDLGVDGMGIPIGKLSLYTLCAGIHPAKTLPITLDVGTNNKERLTDPRYLGMQKPRVSGDDYTAFIEDFVHAIYKRWPNVILQWEDFAQQNATPILERFKNECCTFNDDIQGTASITLATFLSALKVAGRRLKDERIALMGAGSAGVGIANMIAAAMVADGADPENVHQQFYLHNSKGLLQENLSDQYRDFQMPFVRSAEEVNAWELENPERIALLESINNGKITTLIGVSGVPGLFTQEVVDAVDANSDRPIVLPLSNPTSKSEGLPEDIIQWTKGRAIVATGSPFAPVEYEGQSIQIAQCNNAYIFPGLGLGVSAVNASRISDAMFITAAEALAKLSPAMQDASASLLPSLNDIREVSKHIAFEVALKAQAEGFAEACSEDELREKIQDKMWEPVYPVLKYVKD